MLSDVRERASVEKLQGEHETCLTRLRKQGTGAPHDLLQGPEGPEIVSKPLGEHDRALVREMTLTREFSVKGFFSLLAANSSYKCVFTDCKAVLVPRPFGQLFSLADSISAFRFSWWRVTPEKSIDHPQLVATALRPEHF